MPQYLDADVPMARRRDCKDDKVYRTRFGYFGPNIISKYICDANEDTSVVSVDGNLAAWQPQGEQSVSARVLMKTDPWGINDFCVPYSCKKKGRWVFMEQARTIVASQDKERGVRVSVIRSKIPQRTKEEGNTPENFVGETLSSQLVTDFYSLDSDRVIHREGKRMNFASVSKKPNPPRHRRGRLIRSPVNSPAEVVPDENENQSEKGAIHVVYKEQYFEMSKREINSNKRMKREKHARITLHRHSKRFPSDETTDAYNAVCDEWNYDEYEYAELENPRCYTDIDMPMTQSLDGFIVMKNRPRNGNKRRRREVDYPAEDSPNVIVIESDKGSSGTVPPLLTITFPLLSDISFCSLIENKIPNARKVDRLYPATYAVEVENKPCETLETVVPKGFVGTVFIQDAGISQGVVLLRCILNESRLQDDLQKRNSTNKIFCNVNQGFGNTVLSPIGHLPKEIFANVEVYTGINAVCLALSQYSAKATESCKSDTSESANWMSVRTCGSCYCEEESLIALQCRHYFCRLCWARYIINCMQNARVPITCPEYGCECVLEVDHAMTILPAVECMSYAKMLLNDVVLTAPGNFHCIQCSSLIHIVDSYETMKAVACQCGAVMCSSCKKSFHMPLDCATAYHYSKIRQLNAHIYSSPAEDVTIKVKQCPSCKAFCQRWTGCDHMSCACGVEFCYRCLGLWNEGEHGKCEEQQFEKVLHDEPQVFVGKFPIRLFRRCQRLRLHMNPDTLRALQKMLRISRIPFIQRNHFLQCYTELCQLMEVLTVHYYFEGRRLGFLKPVRIIDRLPLNAICVGDSLQFLKTSLEAACTDRANANARSRFLTIAAKIDKILTSSMLHYCFCRH